MSEQKMSQMFQKKFATRNAHALGFLLGMTLALQACTGDRAAKFDNEDLAGTVIEIAQIHGARGSVSVSSDDATTPLRGLPGAALRVEGQVRTRLTSLATYRGPDRLALLFKELPVRLGSKESENLDLVFRVDAGAIQVSRLARLSDLESDLDRALAKPIPGVENVVEVPIMQVKVERHGIVRRSKNSLGEATRSLELVDRDYTESSHVQVNLLSRLTREDLVTDTKDSEQRFRKSALVGKLFAKKDLLEQLNVRVSDESVTDAALFQVRMGRRASTLDLYRIKDKKDLTQAETEALASGESVLMACDQAARDDASAKGVTLPADCVLVSEFTLDVTFESAKREAVTLSGGETTLAPGVKYEPTLKASDAVAVSIVKFQEVRQDSNRGLMGTRAMNVAALRGKEFLMRRTLQDSPNGFDFAFAGLSGSLEIVKFKFERDKVAVVRARPLVPNAGGSHVDSERLMVLPVQYKKLLKSSDGTARVVQAEFDEAEAIAEVGLENDQLVKNDTSPMSFYDFSVCFNESGDKVLADVDNRLTTEGALNFTVSSTYVTSPSPSCRFIYQQTDFMSANQTAFRFDERISFQAYQDQDETPLRSLPYSAQKRLGFGLFTREKTVPSAAGNTGTEKTQIPMAALFDIRNGQKIQYVLSGLPETGELRDRIVEATREVLADLNRGMRAALKGSALERSDDILELKVEGTDPLPLRKMGDLDRNYIYYVQKATESGVIGLGGAHPNPRTGRVEAASVFMYGGNMIAMVENLRKRERAQKDYDELLGILSMSGLQEILGGGGGGSSGSGTGGKASIAQQAFPAFGSQASPLAFGGPFDAKAALATSDFQRLGDYQSVLKALKAKSPSLREGDGQTLSGHSEAFVMYRAFRQVLEQKAYQNEHKAAAIFAEAILRAFRDQMSADAALRMEARVKASQGTAELMNRIQGSGTCVYDVSTAAESVAANLGNKSLVDMSDLDALVAVWKPTLAHELGHNLGLRHNFIGTADKDNHKFEPNESTPRDYSSVMDYNPNDHYTYDGLGPYDVAALRAGYAGLLELAPDTVQKHVGDVGGVQVLKGVENVPVVAGKLVAIEDYKKALGVTSWLNFSTSLMSELPLKPYRFCDDGDAGQQPLCNRFDSGTTPEEIVAANMRQYESLYSLRNLVGDQVRFGYDTLPSYLGRVVGIMLPIRQFLEETVYQLVEGAPRPLIQQYVGAAVDGFQFFHGIIRTPDASSDMGYMDSFVPLKVSQGGQPKTIVVQQKWLQDMALDDTSERLLVRGIEYDKLFSILMLTERNMGWERYERRSLRFSYPEFERLIIQGAAPVEMPTNSLLLEILSNHLEPSVRVPGSGLMRLPLSFESDVTELMRVYALIGLMINQDVSGLEAKDNNSALFRVLSGFAPPVGVTSVVQPGANAASSTSLKFWAMDQAEGSAQMVTLLEGAADLESKRKDLEANTTEWVILTLGPQPNASDAAAVAAHEAKRQASEAALEQKLAALKPAVGQVKTAQVLKLFQSVIKVATALSTDPTAADVTVLNRQMTRIAKSELVYSVLLSGLVQAAADLKLEVLQEVVGRGALNAVAVQRGVMSGNLDTMNRVLLSTHPELR